MRPNIPPPHSQPSLIPPDLLIRLEKAKSLLRHNGSVQARSRKGSNPSFVVIYRDYPESGKRNRYSVPVPPGSADAVRQLLARWQEEEREETRRAIEQERSLEESWDWIQTQVLMIHGHSHRQRRRINALFREARSKGPFHFIHLMSDEPWMKRKPLGRPRRSGLGLPGVVADPIHEPILAKAGRRRCKTKLHKIRPFRKRKEPYLYWDVPGLLASQQSRAVAQPDSGSMPSQPPPPAHRAAPPPEKIDGSAS